MIDLPPVPDLWLPSKPAIIRPADDLVFPKRRLFTPAGLFPMVPPVPSTAAAFVTSFTFTDSQFTAGADNYDNNPTVSIGAAATGGDTRTIIVVLCATFFSASADTLDSATIGGVSAIVDVAGLIDSAAVVAIFHAEVPSGTTAAIAPTFGSGDPSDGLYAVYSLITAGSVSATDADTDSGQTNPLAGSVTVGDEGVVVAGCAGVNTADPSGDWTGLTEDVTADVRSTEYCASASEYFETATTAAATVDMGSSAPQQNYAMCSFNEA